MSTQVTGDIDHGNHWQEVAQDSTARKENREWGDSDTSWVFVEGGTTPPKKETINVFADTSAITQL